MKGIYHAAHAYMIVGLASGLYYRELTKARHFTGDSQLGLIHTHVLALGMLFFLVVLVLEKQFALTASRLFGWFFWVYNGGLAVTVAMMAVHGTLTVLGHRDSEAVSLVAGLGHVVLTVGLILLFVMLGRRLGASSPAPDHESLPAPTALSPAA